MKEKGVWGRVKEGAFWVAEKSTFITVPLGILFAGEAILAKEFWKAAVLGAFVAIDVVMYKFFKNRREQMKGAHASLHSESQQTSNLLNLETYRGSERLDHSTRLAA